MLTWETTNNTQINSEIVEILQSNSLSFEANFRRRGDICSKTYSELN
jgi:hypothetical protein